MSYEDENTKVIWLKQGDILLLVSEESRQVHEVSENEDGKLETSTYAEIGAEEDKKEDDDEEEDDEEDEDSPEPLPAS